MLDKALPEIFLCLSFFGTLEGQRHDITILDHIREVKYQRACEVPPKMRICCSQLEKCKPVKILIGTIFDYAKKSSISWSLFLYGL